MACYRPLVASRTPSGAVRLWERGDGRQLELPCGRCIGCRMARARSWTVRLEHEASCHDQSRVVTLTYEDAALPAFGELVYRDFQLFMKRLRRRKGKVRFFVCGEYGGLSGRPHFHAVLFGMRFSDEKPLCNGKLESAECADLWKLGGVCLDIASVEGFAYVAGYVTKKASREDSELYDVVDFGTGEVYRRRSEFVCMSRRPGIGADWYQRFKSDLWRGDRARMMDGKALPVPRFYLERLKRESGYQYERIVEGRLDRAEEREWDETPERLLVREEYARLKDQRVNERRL